MFRYLIILVIWGAGAVIIYWKSDGKWEIIAAIATWFLALGVAFAFLQLRQARKSTNAQIAMSLFNELRSSESIEKIRLIYDLKQDEFKYLPRYKEKEIDYILDRFDTLGNFVTEGIINRKLAIETYGGPPALRCWYKLCRGFIRETQKDRGYYCENYENFTRLCLDYFHKKGIEVKFRAVGEEERELVKELKELTRTQKNALVENKLYPRTSKEIRKDRK